MAKREVTPQRKAFLDAIAVGEGTDNGRQKTANHGYDVIVGGTLFTDYSDHPRKLVQLNPQLKSTAAGRYQLLSRYYDAYKNRWACRTSRRKARIRSPSSKSRSAGRWLISTRAGLKTP